MHGNDNRFQFSPCIDSEIDAETTRHGLDPPGVEDVGTTEIPNPTKKIPESKQKGPDSINGFCNSSHSRQLKK